MKITRRQLRQIVLEACECGSSPEIEKEAGAKAAALSSASTLSKSLKASGTSVDDWVLSRVYTALLRMSRLLQNRTISGKYKDTPRDIEIEPPAVEDAFHPSEVEAREGAWSGGDNIEDPLDHAYFETRESNAGPHVVLQYKRMRENKMKITRRQLNNLVRESIDREKLVRYIAGELSNRAYDIGLLDDINDADPDALDFTLPEVLVSNLGPDPSQEQWSGLAKDIAAGVHDAKLAEIADPEEDEDPGDPAELRGIGSTPFSKTKSDYDDYPAWFNEGKIKITKGKLRQIIKEELSLIEGCACKTCGSVEKCACDNHAGGHEGRMARGQLARTAQIAQMLHQMIQDDTNLDEWVESKITKAQDYLSTVLNYMSGKHGLD